MLSWKVGDVTITRVVELEVPVPWSEEHAFLKEATPETLRTMPWLYPHFVRPEDDAMLLSFHALLVDAPGMRLVVDTCIGNDKPRKELGMQALSTPFLDHMRDAGWPPESVDAVVCTHLHVDHVGWNTRLEDGKWVPTFPNARYLIGRVDHQHWSGNGDETDLQILADSVQPIFDAGLADYVEMDHVLTPEVRLVPTPGHTPGHVSVMIESKSETAFITGDALHHPSQMTYPDWCPSVDVDQILSPQTRRTLLADAESRGLLFIGTHFAGPTAGRVVKDGANWRLEV
jgi:glyoxylase-like metal-dependent hydrolase (beta-lactamase superfamily II)